MKTDFDVIVVGAGINGAGIARDAAMRRLKVLLVDKGDIGGGTSAGSTRLIHGGLRYLEHFEFGLVRESLRERETLLRIAPHLVRPLPITIPIYEHSQRGRATIRAGMIAYDLLSWGKSLPRHRMLSARETLRQMPGLKTEGLVGSAVYYDAQVEFAERLVLENVLAAVEYGATVLTYTRVTDFVIDEGLLAGVRLDGNKADQFRAAVVVNAAGPWVDRLLNKIETNKERLVGGTKGSHVVVAPFTGAPASAVYLEAVSDRRPFFIIPWNGNYLIGTTDVRFEGDPDQVQAEDWEIDYLLSETNRAFPGAELSRDRVLYTYAGVRPLPFTKNHNERSITRRHFLREHPRFGNLVSVVGGKLTTYRSLAEECVDLVLRKRKRGFTPSQTARVPLPGASDLEPDASDLDQSDRFQRWSRVYGSRAKEIAKVANRLNCDALAAEIVFAFENEFAKTMADCFLRRTMIGLDADLGLEELEAAASVAQRFLGWSEDRAKREVELYKQEISDRIDNGFHRGQ
ncbi:MAG TPA: glycerol-3-phosphate dehydrogenase [Pyrinomonadaceae bacterium]|nr:glycerol-3-phosphate dehydrogenase [Pyrinomonadaceae bacterium]